MIFVCYPKCSTCQKAKRWLEDNGVAYTARHIKTDNPTKEELTAWIARSGLPIKRFFNTSGLVYKAMGLKDKLPAMSEEEQLALLAAESAPAVVLLADGAESRAAAPLLAEALDAPLFSDVVDIEAGDEVVFTRLPYTAKVIERATAAAPTVGDLSE